MMMTICLILSLTSGPVLEVVEAGGLVDNGGVVGTTGFVLVCGIVGWLTVVAGGEEIGIEHEARKLNTSTEILNRKSVFIRTFFVFSIWREASGSWKNIDAGRIDS